jgi:hypothetical protein
MTVFFRLLDYEDKATALADVVNATKSGNHTANVSSIQTNLFAVVPGSPFAYWVSKSVLQTFNRFEPIESDKRFVRVSNETGDDFRFIRLWTEVNNQNIGRKQGWVNHAKGGQFNRYYYDLHLLLAWDDNRKTVRGYCGRPARPDERLASTEYFFRVGLTYPRRTQKGFSVRILPASSVFANKGPGIFVEDDEPLELLKLLAVMNSRIFRELLSLQMAFGSYEVGVVQRTPIPYLDNAKGQRLGTISLMCVRLKQGLDSSEEGSHLFWLPAVLHASGNTLSTRNKLWQTYLANVDKQVAEYQNEIDELTFQLYNIDDRDQSTINLGLEWVTNQEQEVYEIGDLNGEDAENENNTDHSYDTQPSSFIADLVSYSVGAIVGRWDLRCATSERPRPDLPDPFAPPPAYSPGMLQPTADGLPVAHYQVAGRSFVPHSILVDDPGHPADLITCLQEVLAIIFGAQADAIYQELVDALVGNGHDLRPWLRTTFFDEHIKRYSKSRRKAPIYWCLTIPSRRYALWLYYHRLSRDTLYTVLNDYLGPKLDHEQRQLTKLRAEAGANPNAEQRKAIESQASLIAELQTLRDEVRRVAPLWQPDLNDGVIINFAPLWHLAPWPRRWQSDCQNTWEALRQGDYDWSHLALHLWPARVIAKCRTDRSLAIAHGLDEHFWQLDGDGKASPRPVTEQTVQVLIAAHTSAAVTAALAALDDAPVTTAKPVKAPPAPRTNRSPRARKAGTADQQSKLDLQEGED